MMYVAKGRLINEEEKDDIFKMNTKLVELADETGDINWLMDYTIVIPVGLAKELAERKC